MRIIHRMRSFGAVLAGLVASGCGGDQPPDAFGSAYEITDTVVTVGDLDESNALFVYGRLGRVWLADSTLVAFSDQTGARMVVADLLSGAGWEIASARGASGPGEFNGETPQVFPSWGRIHALTSDRLQTFSPGGEFLGSTRVQPQAVHGRGSDFAGRVVGVVSGRVVVSYSDALDWEESAPQTLGSGIRIVDPETARVFDVRLDGTSHVVRVEDRPDGSKAGVPVTEQVPVVVAARHDLIVYSVGRTDTLVVLSDRGSTIVTRAIGYPIWDISIDAEGRVWAGVDARSDREGAKLIVFDRDLAEQFRVVARNVLDAHGQYVLTLVRDPDLDLLSLSLGVIGDR